jgi:long-chain acyl-CoA synthetase
MIKGSRFVSQVVLVGNERKFAAALIVPSFDQIESYARTAGIEDQDPAVLCSHPKIIELFEHEVERLTTGLARYESVKRIALLERELTIDGGELTPTLKVKRRVIDEKYRDIIEQLYKD